MRQMLHKLLATYTRNTLRPSLVIVWILFHLFSGLQLNAYPSGEIGSELFLSGKISLNQGSLIYHAPSVGNPLFVCDANAGTITPTVNSICVEGDFANLQAVPDGNMIIPPGFTVSYILSSGANSLVHQVDGSPQFTVSEEGLYTIHTLVYDPSTFDLNTIILEVTTINDLNVQFEQGGGDICAAMDLNGADILTEKAIAIVIFTTNENCDDIDGSASLAPVSNTFLWPDNFLGRERFDLADGVYAVTATQNTGLGCTTVLEVTIGENCGPNSCAANAGSLSANANSVCLDNNSVTISANPSGTAVVPAGFITTYVLVANGTIAATSSLSTFTVSNINDYSIHTLIHDPVTLPLTSIVPNSTTPQDVNSQLEQGGGTICASLDLMGADVSVINCGSCLVDAGTLTANANPVCLDVVASISATPAGDAVVPTGFITTYLQVVGGVVTEVSATPSFFVSNINNYTIHTLVHEISTLPVNSIIINTTTAQQVNALLEQGGGTICGALDLTGASIGVIDCGTQCNGPQVLNIITTESNCGQSTGSATINVVGNNNDYTFNFSGGNINGNSASGLTAGTYSVTITETANTICTVEASFSIGNADGPMAEIISTSSTSCNAANGTAQLSPATFNYQWCDGGTGNTRNGLTAGACPVTVTDPATGCINILEVVIPIDNLLDIVPIINQQPNCNASDGVVVISVNFGSNDYTYTWSDNPSIDNPIRNNLAGGIYGVTVVDNGPNGCQGEITFSLLENTTSSATITIQNTDVLVSCPGDVNGNVQYSIAPDAGFIQPLSEQIVDAMGMVYTNGSLPVGNYCIEVTDGGGCLAAAECFEVSEPDALVVDVSTIATTCAQGGSITLNVSGGTGTYNFNWTDLPASNPQNRTDLSAGNYSVVVSDGNGCLVTLNNINVADGCTNCPATAGSLSIDASPLIYDGINPVQVSATQSSNPNVPGGYSTLYVLTSGAGLEVVTVSTSPSFMVNALGQYTIHTLVYDPTTLDPTQYTNGLDLNADLLQGGGTICAALDVVGATAQVISDGTCTTPIVANIVVIEATCGNANGLATIEMAGASNYNFQWSSGGSTTNSASGLEAGTYTVTITDAGNPTCLSTKTFIIGNADGPIMSIFSQTPTSCNTSNGTAVLEPQTNLFDWSDGTAGAIRTNLAPGTNYVTVTDPATNCINVFEVFIESVNNLDIQTNITQQPSCGSANGSLDITVTGGSTNYSYLWSDGSNAASRTNMSAGTYGLTIVDNGPNSCKDSIYFVLANTVTGDATVNIVNPSIQETCAGANDGSVDYSVGLSPGFIQPSNERIVDMNGTEYSNGQLPVGNYCIEVLDGTGCYAGGSCFEILAAPTLVVDVEVDPVTCTSTGEIRIKPYGGTGTYTFDWVDLPNTSDPQDRFDLAAGQYSVTITDVNGCQAIADNILVQDECTSCPTASEETLTLPINSVDSIPFIIESCFDAAQTTFVLLDGTTSGSSAFGSWVVGPNGTLIYTAGNTSGIQIDTICIVANFNVLMDTTCVIVTITPECNGQDIIPDETVTLTTQDCATGIEYCLPISSSTIGNYTITDNGTAFDPGTTGCDFDSVFFYSLLDFLNNAPSGPYTLTNWMFDGNTFSIDTFQTMSQLADSMNVWDTDGNWFLSGTVITGGAPNISYGQLVVEQIGTGVSAALNPELDTVNPLGTLITLDTGFHQIILADLTTGCIDTVGITVECDDCVPFYNGPFPVMIDDCDGLASICVDVPITQLGNIDIDGTPYTGSVVGCGFDTLSNCYSYFTLPNQGSGAAGPYNLDLWSRSTGPISGAQFDSIEALVTLLNGWDPTGNWTLNPATFTICGGSSGVVYDSLNITQINTGIVSSFLPDLDIFTFAISIEVDTGFHVIEMSNTVTGCTDVFDIQVNCDLTPGQDTTVQVFVSETDTFCFDFQDTIATVNTNLCPNLADGNVAGFAYIPGTNCVEYTGMVLGVDTFCVEFCFTNGTCETYNIAVEVVPQLLSGDTIPVDVIVNFTEQYCIDTSPFLAPIDTIYNYCDDLSGTYSEVSIVQDSLNCIDILGNVVGGLDTACIVICDTLGVCDTTIFLINIIPPSPDTITQIIELGADSIYCVDSTQLFGNLVSIDNFCAGSSGTNVDFTVNADTFCLNYTGLEIGMDTACIEICDDLGVCDTIIFIVDVVLPLDTIVAVDDDTITSTINPVTIDILANDIFNGDCSDLIFGVLDGVDHGTLVINIDCSVTYLAEPGFCGEIDSFTYFISNGMLSDTATVSIEVLCDNIEVFTGFSPNDDGVNDALYIQGIDNFPDNEVCLFNRWGNQVFRQKGYSNSEPWAGTFEGKDLPDGTYFYTIDDGEGNKYTGWVHILR